MTTMMTSSMNNGQVSNSSDGASRPTSEEVEVEEDAIAAKGAQSAAQRRKRLRPSPVLDEESLVKALEERDIKRSHADQIWRHVVQNGVEKFRDIPNLPKAAYEVLESRFNRLTSVVEKRTDSPDGSTTKLLVKMQDGRRVECVLMRYGAVDFDSFPEHLKRRGSQQSVGEGVEPPPARSDSKPENAEGSMEEGGGGSEDTCKESRVFKSKRRVTVCVSCQVGCRMRCTFCATGAMGLAASLTAGEILEQLVHASKIEKVRNVVFMGMGEPLDNYGEVVAAIRGITDVRRFNVAAHRVSVSTVGVVPRIRSLASDAPGVSLALSLHAPTQALRERIVPSAKGWPIEKVIAAADAYVESQRKANTVMAKLQTLLVEYILIADVNDGNETAHDLGRLLEPRKENVMLNCIPYNPTSVAESFEAPTDEHVDGFVTIVRSYGVKVTVRQRLGQEIGGACGQLLLSSAPPPSESTAPMPTIEEACGLPSKPKSRRLSSTQGRLQSNFGTGDVFEQTDEKPSKPRAAKRRRSRSRHSTSAASGGPSDVTTTTGGAEEDEVTEEASSSSLSSPLQIEIRRRPSLLRVWSDWSPSRVYWALTGGLCLSALVGCWIAMRRGKWPSR